MASCSTDDPILGRIKCVHTFSAIAFYWDKLMATDRFPRISSHRLSPIRPRTIACAFSHRGIDPKTASRPSAMRDTCLVRRSSPGFIFMSQALASGRSSLAKEVRSMINSSANCAIVVVPDDAKVTRTGSCVDRSPDASRA